MEWAPLVAAAMLVLTAAGIVAAWAIKISKGESASAKVDVLAKELSEFKERVARDYATTSMVTSVERTMADAFNRLTDRIDRLLEQRPAATRTTRSTKP